MNIRKLNNGDKATLEEFLLKHIDTSLFLLSNMYEAGLVFKGEPRQGEYWASFTSDGQISGVLAHYHNNNVIIQIPDFDVMISLIEVFKSEISRPIAGILGAKKQLSGFVKLFDFKENLFAKNDSEDLYTLDLDDMLMPLSFDASQHRMVDVSAVDKGLLYRWFEDYESEALGTKNKTLLQQRVEQRIDRVLNHGDCWVLEADGEFVSLSGFNSSVLDIVQIGPVWTPHEFRNRGYARIIVALTLRMAHADGAKRSVLFTDNPAAAKAYEALGFKKCGSYGIALFKEPLNL